MMDWTESLGFSIGQRVTCAQRVHRKIRKNLATSNVSKLSEVNGGGRGKRRFLPCNRAANGNADVVNGDVAGDNVG
jgi:hypothetical protein